MDGGQSLSRPYAEDARWVLAVAALLAAGTGTGEPDAEAPPVCVSGKHLLDALQDNNTHDVRPVPSGTRLTPLVRQILNEASRISGGRNASEVSADDISVGATNVMKATGLDPRKISEIRLHAHLF
jgi:hypothetical protein